jgi:hypothetical protein
MECYPSPVNSAQALDYQRDEWSTTTTSCTFNAPGIAFEVPRQSIDELPIPLRLQHSLASDNRTGSPRPECAMRHHETNPIPLLDCSNLGGQLFDKKTMWDTTLFSLVWLKSMFIRKPHLSDILKSQQNPYPEPQVIIWTVCWSLNIKV